MILSISFSKPAADIEARLGRPYKKARIIRNAKASLSGKTVAYEAEFFTQTQAFQQQMTEQEVQKFIESHAGTTFKIAVERTETSEITIRANRHGAVKTFTRALSPDNRFAGKSTGEKKKAYLLPEGVPVSFLVRLGVMTREGKVVTSKYDKYRQINRFLEYIRDILGDIERIATGGEGFSAERPLRIADFGCGKSYLTFATYYFLSVVQKVPVQIAGLDLKESVIADCQKLARDCQYGGLNFAVGNIADYAGKEAPDLIITLHACDTATDFALEYAVRRGAVAILSVPCCQHEINNALSVRYKDFADDSPFASLTRHGILRERFAALATDAIRAELLEEQGYSVQLLEFIDMSHTPKNLLIRAVRKSGERDGAQNSRLAAAAQSRKRALLATLGTQQTLDTLLDGTSASEAATGGVRP